MTGTDPDTYRQAADMLRASRHNTAFTGAGISVESGIPPFRGENGLWSRHDPVFLDMAYFHRHPLQSWQKIKEIFYDFFGGAEPNEAHKQLASLESRGLIKSVITQNIDNLHQEAGSRSVIEFHGTSKKLICTACGAITESSATNLEDLPPRCPECNEVLKPDFVFFGDAIPAVAQENSMAEAESADVFLVIGTTGEIMPASVIPVLAKKNGARIIEINIEESRYTHSITDVFIKEKASSALRKLSDRLSR